jgi:RNA polymerase sigma factor (sigma-70 family)
VKDYYTLAKVACYKVNIWENQREDAIQYIVMKLWEDNLPDYLESNTLVTYACNKAKDYLRVVNGRDGHKTLAAQVSLFPEHLTNIVYNPEEALHKKIDLDRLPKSAKNMLEEYIVNGKEYKEIGEGMGVSEGRISQLFKKIIDKEYFSGTNPKRKIK